MIVDLHSHTTASDGVLTPRELILRARENGVDCLAITDHDTVAAYDDPELNRDSTVNLITGIEFSAGWHGLDVHIVGLNVIPDSEALTAAVDRQLKARTDRAKLIAERLAAVGIDNALDGARRIAGNDNLGRPHFAAYLQEIGAVSNGRQAFRKYLGHGKPGHVRGFWQPVRDVVQWIRDAGGTAVLAHPAHYKLTNTRLLVLCDEFIAAGGTAIEVVSGRQHPDVTARFGRLADEKGLLASCGSDFHRPGTPWSELGRASPLPSGCRPVWDTW